MKKRLIIAFVLALFLTTYNNQEFFKKNSNLFIKNIYLENILSIDEKEIKRNLAFLYDTNILLLNIKKIESKLSEIDIIDSFKIKKIYPNTIKITIFEKIPLAIIQDKKDKSYYTKEGDVINYFDHINYKNLPLVFGDKESFKIFYNNLKKIEFPMNEIDKFYLFESKRWDLLTKDNKTIKLPIKEYEESLKNYLKHKDEVNFNKYKIFDYRISNQLILK